MEKLAERVAWAIEVIKDNPSLDKGINDVALAKILGTNKDTLADYRNQKGLLKGEVIERLVSYYKFSPAWLFQGVGEPFPGAREKYESVCGPDSTFVSVGTGEPGEFVYVPQLEGKICCGNGIAPENAIKTQIAFRRDWISRKGNPADMCLIKVAGDSMEPTLFSGDMVLVDHSRNYLDPHGGIYAVYVDDAIMIKRLHAEYPTTKVRIISDNPKYRPIEVDADQVKINGKVIWFGRELER